MADAPPTTPFDLLPHDVPGPGGRFRLAELGTLPPTLNLTTAGRLLGIGRSTAYALVQQGQFPCATFKVGHQHRVATAVLLRFLGVTVAEPEPSMAPVQAE